MKKLCLAILCLVVFLSGCGGTAVTKEDIPSDAPNTEVSQEEVLKKEFYTLTEKGSPINNFVITLTNFVKQKEIKGDKVERELAVDKGYIFADTKNLVPTNDYNVFKVDALIENNTDKALSLSDVGWSAKLPDGYKLGMLSPSKTLSGQVASHNRVNGAVTIIIDKSLNAKEILLTYNYLDYNDEWSKAMADAIAGKLSESEYKSKFKPIPITWKLNVQ